MSIAAPPDTDLVPRLRIATMRLVRLLRQHADAETGLSQSLISTLGTIARTAPVTLGRLAELERVQPPSMTKVVAGLEERGLVARTVDDKDRRVARVTLTAEGDAVLGGLRARKNDYLHAHLADLSPADRGALERALPALERLAGVEQ